MISSVLRLVRASVLVFPGLWLGLGAGTAPHFELVLSSMRQQSFFKPSRKEHGGVLSLGTRRSRRPLSTKHALHFTLRSDFAYGPRSLLKHQALINHIGRKFSRRFGVRIYRQAICGNHLHLLIRGVSREGLQNFFRVFAGHVAQQILGTAPITELERSKVRGGAPTSRAKQRVGKTNRRSEAEGKAQSLALRSKQGNLTAAEKPLRGCQKNQRKFWALLSYTRVISWGKEFNTVSGYILKNTLEALKLIAYQPRNRSKNVNFKISTA